MVGWLMDEGEIVLRDSFNDRELIVNGFVGDNWNVLVTEKGFCPNLFRVQQQSASAFPSVACRELVFPGEVILKTCCNLCS